MSDSGQPTKEFLERKEFLLHQARRARMKFVLEARDKSVEASSLTVTKPGSHRVTVPAVECVQEVLDFLHAIVPGTDAVDVEQLLVSVQDPTDLDEDWRQFQQITATESSRSDYDVFLQTLLLPQAAPVVNLLQQFTLKTQLYLRKIQEQSFEPPMMLSFTNPAPQVDARRGSAKVPTKDNESDGAGTPEELWETLQHTSSLLCEELALWTHPDRQTLGNCIEKFLFHHVGHLLQQLHRETDEDRRNQLTFDRLQALQFIVPDHLDLRVAQPFIDLADGVGEEVDFETQLQPAVQMLRRFSSVWSPSEKVNVLKDTSVLVSQVLRDRAQRMHISATSSSNSRMVTPQKSAAPGVTGSPDSLPATPASSAAWPGADEFLPTMILVVLRAAKSSAPTSSTASTQTQTQPQTQTPTQTQTPQPFGAQLHTDLRLLQRYLRPVQMLGEAGYLVTQFASAVYFLENVDGRALKIAPEAFEQELLRAEQAAQFHAQQFHKQRKSTAASSAKGGAAAGSASASASGGSSGAAKKRLDVAAEMDLARLLRQYKKELQTLESGSAAASASASSGLFQHYVKRQGGVTTEPQAAPSTAKAGSSRRR